VSKKVLGRENQKPCRNPFASSAGSAVLKKDDFALPVSSRVRLRVFPKPVSFLVTHDAKSYQILGRVVSEAAPRLNVMDLKAFDLPARLATPTVPLEDLVAELAVSLGPELQAWPFGSNSSQGTT
jgi:hypothetical protein